MKQSGANRPLPSMPDRDAPCPHLPPCPGCPRFGELGPALAQLSRVQALARSFGIEPDVVRGEERGFRRRARLALRGRAGRPKVGIFQAGTHRVVDIPACVIHHPVINQVVRALRQSARELGVSCYSEGSHLGLLRGLQVAVERECDTAQVVVITNSSSVDSSWELLQRLALELGESLHSLWWNGNPDVTNRVLGADFKLISGPEFLPESFGGASVFLGPGAFGQNNTNLFSRLVERVHAWVPEGARVVEYYAGVGSIGLGLLRKVSTICFNEVSPASLVGLAQGIQACAELLQSRACVVPGPAGKHAALVEHADVVLVDPPRKGLDRELLEALVKSPPERLIYVSCGLDAFERELPELCQSLRLRELCLYDMFPFTDHLETLALFERL